MKNKNNKTRQGVRDLSFIKAPKRIKMEIPDGLLGEKECDVHVFRDGEFGWRECKNCNHQVDAWGNVR